MKTYQKYEEIDIYNNSAVIYLRKPSVKISCWVNILVFCILIFICMALFYEYKISNIYYAKVSIEEEQSYIYMTVDNSFISYKNRNYLNINGEDYPCHLESFSDNYYLVNSKKMWDVIYSCEIPENLKFDGNILQVEINVRKTTIYKEFVNKLRKELDDGRIKN